MTYELMKSQRIRIPLEGKSLYKLSQVSLLLSYVLFGIVFLSLFLSLYAVPAPRYRFSDCTLDQMLPLHMAA